MFLTKNDVHLLGESGFLKNDVNCLCLERKNLCLEEEAIFVKKINAEEFNEDLHC